MCVCVCDVILNFDLVKSIHTVKYPLNITIFINFRNMKLHVNSIIYAYICLCQVFHLFNFVFFCQILLAELASKIEKIFLCTMKLKDAKAMHGNISCYVSCYWL